MLPDTRYVSLTSAQLSLRMANKHARFRNESTSMAASPLHAITWLPTSARTSRAHSARRRARLSCTQRPEGISCLCARILGCSSLTFGSLIGIGEIVLLPLDVLKIKRQTNPDAFRGRGIFKIISDEGFGLYRGWGWTAARNAPGSFAVRVSRPLRVGYG